MRDWVRSRPTATTNLFGGNDLLVTELPCKKTGQASPSERVIDAEVQAIIRSMHDGGAVVFNFVTRSGSRN